MTQRPLSVALPLSLYVTVTTPLVTSKLKGGGLQTDFLAHRGRCVVLRSRD